MTAPTDAPVEERHRRAAWEHVSRRDSALGECPLEILAWIISGDAATVPVQLSVFPAIAQVAANAERDGRASRDAEVEELRAYRRAWERWLELNAPFARNAGERILAEELARKGTP